MSKSIYENYADIQQPKILCRRSEKSLYDAIEKLQYYKNHYSELVYTGAVSIVAELYERQESEIEKLVDGEEYWIV